MTLPRQRLPGATYFITKTCDRFEFRLKPTPTTNAAFAIALMDAADRAGVRVCAICAMSSHYHAVVYDPYGRLSDFLRDFHGLLGRFGNARDGIRGCGFWDRQQTDTQLLGDAAAIVAKTAYCLANPTTSFVVARPEEWIGVRTRLEDLGTWRGPVFERPATFFDADTWVSELAELTSEVPPMAERAYGVDGFRKRVAAQLERLVAKACAEARDGPGFTGLAAVKRRSVWHASPLPSPRTVGREAGPRRHVAAAQKGRLLAMLSELLAFRRAHRAAWDAFRRGLAVVFPCGTWKAWRFYGAHRDLSTYEWTDPAPC